MKSLWAYAYEIVPPQPSRRLGPIRTLLKDATAAARGGARTWSGRLVLERGATHILIVGDAPGRNHSIDRWLEAELERLDAAFSVTEPLPVVTEPLAVAGHAEGSNRWFHLRRERTIGARPLRVVRLPARRRRSASRRDFQDA